MFVRSIGLVDTNFKVKQRLIGQRFIMNMQDKKMIQFTWFI